MFFGIQDKPCTSFSCFTCQDLVFEYWNITLRSLAWWILYTAGVTPTATYLHYHRVTDLSLKKSMYFWCHHCRYSQFILLSGQLLSWRVPLELLFWIYLLLVLFNLMLLHLLERASAGCQKVLNLSLKLNFTYMHMASKITHNSPKLDFIRMLFYFRHFSEKGLL